VAFFIADKLGQFNAGPVFIASAGFISFVVTYLMLYYFYFVTVARRMHSLHEKIRLRFFGTEIPAQTDQLEEVDVMENLDKNIDRLAELRARESAHFENLDSYRKEYLGNVSHELKTPVFNIQGYIDTLLNGGLEDPSVNREFLHRAERSIDRLISIIDDLETITQLESGVLELDSEDFDIAGLCRDVYSSLEMSAVKKNISLQLERKYEKPILVHADKFRIRQVLVNLVSNSIKYGREGGITKIALAFRNDDVIVEIEDNGPGIDDQHLDRIFERFYRIDKGRSREQGGTGLGLAIVKHIIEAHGRSVKAESSSGSGTRFILSLPAAS
jgi:two-component system, OmpR family, phosphate regulon sensor histidine kinase PhoR